MIASRAALAPVPGGIETARRPVHWRLTYCPAHRNHPCSVVVKMTSMAMGTSAGAQGVLDQIGYSGNFGVRSPAMVS